MTDIALSFIFCIAVLRVCVVGVDAVDSDRYWAFCAAHMCVFDSRTSQLAQAMFLGCYIHGVALFGVEKCFYVSEEEDKLGGSYA